MQSPSNEIRELWYCDDCGKGPMSKATHTHCVFCNKNRRRSNDGNDVEHYMPLSNARRRQNLSFIIVPAKKTPLRPPHGQKVSKKIKHFNDLSTGLNDARKNQSQPEVVESEDFTNNSGTRTKQYEPPSHESSTYIEINALHQVGIGSSGIPIGADDAQPVERQIQVDDSNIPTEIPVVLNTSSLHWIIKGPYRLRYPSVCSRYILAYVTAGIMSLGLGISWSIWKNDVSAGFTLAAYILALGIAITMPLHSRHNKKCRCK